jgi:CHAT domain-containing protein/tetratricopeptide (TPR) repeat protein
LQNALNTRLAPAAFLLLFVALLLASATLANNSTHRGILHKPFLSGAAQSSAGVARLAPGKLVEQDHAAGLTRDFLFTIIQDRYYHIGVEQQGIDVKLKLNLPDGKVIERDWPNSRWGPESISFIADVGGDARLQVVSAKRGVQTEKYLLRLDEPRDPTERDRNRVAGEEAYWQGYSTRNRANAIKSYEEAVERLTAAGDQYALALALTSLSFARGSASHNDFSRAMSLWKSLGDPHREAQMLHNAGRLEENRDDPSAALRYYRDALKAWQSLGGRSEPEGEASTCNNLGTLLDQLGETEEALILLKRAVKLFTGSEDTLFEARTNNNLGFVYSNIGEHEEAYKYYSRAQEIYKARKEANDQPLHALTMHNIGVHFLNKGEPNKARQYLDQALDMRKADARGKALTQYVIALALGATGQKREALKLLEEEVLPFHRRVGDLAKEAITLGTTGAFKRQLNDKEGALADFNLALEKSQAQSDRNIEGSILAKVGGLENELGNLTVAEQRLGQAIAIFEQRRVRLVSLDWRASYLASVRGAYENYIDVQMRMYRREGGADRLTKAFKMSEQAHARSLLDLLTEAGADIYRDADPALKGPYLELKRQVNALGRWREALLSGRGTPAQVAKLDGQIKGIIVRMQEAEAQVKKSSAAYTDLTRTEPLSLDEVRGKLVGEDALLLEYFLGEQRSYLFVVSSTGVEGYDLPPRATVEAAARAFYKIVSEKDAGKESDAPRAGAQREPGSSPQNYVDASARLSAMALGPAAGQLGKRKLLIVADGALHYVPFAALPAPSSEGQAAVRADPMVVTHEIVYLPSASTLEVIRERRSKLPTPTKVLAVIADPVFERSDLRYLRLAGRRARGGNSIVQGIPEGERLSQARRSGLESSITFPDGIFPRLPKTETEAEYILSLSPQHMRKDLRGFDANYKTVMSGELSDYKYVHFATHGLVNSQHPALSGIVLSLIDQQGRPQEEGFLQLGDIEGLSLPAEVVVLSACSTASGAEVRGEGLVGLTRGVMRAGSSRVVASLWKADDRATAELMRLFYEGMLKGPRPLAPAAALRVAQEQMWRKYRDKSPYFWAAFVLQGEWR